MKEKKIYKNSVPLEKFLVECLETEEMQKEFLNVSLESFIEDGNFDAFLNSLELVIKSRQSLLSFSKKAELNRSNLYAIFNGKTKPRFGTILKILSELGYTLKVA